MLRYLLFFYFFLISFCAAAAGIYIGHYPDILSTNPFNGSSLFLLKKDNIGVDKDGFYGSDSSDSGSNVMIAYRHHKY